MTPYIRTTNSNGEFSSELPKYGHVALTYIFQNRHLKLRSLDFSGGVFIDALEVINYLMSLPFPVMYSKVVNPFHDINNVNTHFAHGSKHALWGITYNAIQEADDYAVTDGLKSYSPIDFKSLNVLCYYNNSTTSASAPMLGYIGVGVGTGVTNIIFHTLGISSLLGSTLGGLLPDLIISQRADTPVDCHVIRSTVYHEYGHSLHYFKANKWSNAHWLANITKTLAGPGYGTNINGSRGGFLALSEGWADFIGHNYSARKYPHFDDLREFNFWTYGWDTATYAINLENIPTFFNNFIPRGLFHDLMDGGIDEPNDNISGHTILQIYNLFNDATWTIQKFRENWEDTYPSPNNAALFNWYNIDLP